VKKPRQSRGFFVSVEKKGQKKEKKGPDTFNSAEKGGKRGRIH
jgi:hypothetical protein